MMQVLPPHHADRSTTTRRQSHLPAHLHVIFPPPLSLFPPQIWSRSGNLRSTLMQTGHSLYALAWSPDSESVVVGAGRDLAIKGVQVSEQPCSRGVWGGLE